MHLFPCVSVTDGALTAVSSLVFSERLVLLCKGICTVVVFVLFSGGLARISHHELDVLSEACGLAPVI